MSFKHSAILVLAGCLICLLFAAPGRSQTPSPGATPVPQAVVNSECIQPGSDMQVHAWAYSAGYLLCISNDQNAEGETLFQESPIGSGAFKLVKGVGGWLQSNDLEGYGVPAVTATSLVVSLQEQLQ